MRAPMELWALIRILARAISFLSFALAGGCALPSKPDTPISGRVDVLWLNRITYGVNSVTLAEYERRGRSGFLAEQFAGGGAAMPAVVLREIDALEVAHADAAQLLSATNAEYKRINSMADGADKLQARKTLNERGNALAYQATRRELLRAIYSPAQLQEQLVWFWLNHFSVAQSKGSIRWLVGDYGERAIRPHVLGHFRDLVMATLTHPAMLQYLDNAQNAVNHINENYARELMELHTLGVNAGYSQEDVQNLARILTGVGLNGGGSPPKLKPEWQALYRRDGAFEFNPARHDFGAKVLLGRAIRARGFAEVEQAVDVLVHERACAQFISHKLAVYFVSDEPPPALVARMAAAYSRTDGDIAAVLRLMFDSAEFAASLDHKFKDPVHYVVSALRLAYDTRPIANTRPIVNWLNALGESWYGHGTPEGYALTEAGWASSGQVSRRFEIARAIATSNAGLFEPEDGSAPGATGFPNFSTHVYFQAVEPLLSAPTRNALEHASSQQEWNTLLLASPDFNYR